MDRKGKSQRLVSKVEKIEALVLTLLILTSCLK
jgi:hypothetical protein